MVESLVVDLSHLAGVTGGVLRRAHLDACGLSGRDVDRLVRTGVLERLYRDAYRLRPGTEGPGDRFAATVRAVQRDPDRVVTGPAAVAALGLPVFGRPGTVHVALDARGGSSRRSVVRTVAAPPEDQVVVHAGRRVACAARAALDAARLDSLVAGVVAADAALAKGLTTAQALDDVLATMSGLRGAHRARLCRSLACGGSESPGESWSAVVMHQHGVRRPERQHRVRDDQGLIGRVDFWWPSAEVVGEFDGRVKYGRSTAAGAPPHEVLWQEKLREDRLRARGLRVIRWTTTDLRAPGPWIQRLRRSLDGAV
ncbi:MAG: hypothetical protein JWP95_700 [Actinotalea sp.]|nr:hypothetical protein [Actinotalea sp.]